MRALEGAPAVVVGWVMLLGIPLAVLGPRERGTARQIILVLATIVLALIVVAAIVWVSAAWFGRPAFVVPPPLRRERCGANSPG